MPCLICHGDDSPPFRVKPIPFLILHSASALALQAGDVTLLAILDLMWIAFFPPSSTSHPFQLQDVQLWRDLKHIDMFRCDPCHLRSAAFVSLTFDTQKNQQLHPFRCAPLDHHSYPLFLLRLQHSSTPPFPIQQLSWVYYLPTSMQNHYALLAPWLYLVRMLILIASDSLAFGNQMPCSAISMSKLTTLCRVTHLSCFKAAILH
jgi:hypothetical protein